MSEKSLWPTRPCKGCGKPIVWATVDGRAVPLDPRAAIYNVEMTSISNGEPIIEAFRMPREVPRTMVSHFATCPKAAFFSGRTRKAGA